MTMCFILKLFKLS